MSFISIDFFIFLFIVYGLYRILPHKLQNLMLLIASYYFYGSWDWRFLSLIWISTTIDYFIGKKLYIAREKRIRKRLLIFSLCTNLGLLGIFKYYGFFVDSLSYSMQLWGLTLDTPTLRVIVPVGISFYTFQTLSYTIDIYKNKLKPINNFLDFALFVAFFPQLVAGPIERASNLIPQILLPRSINFGQSIRGIFLILFGLFKKIAIADGVAGSVNSVFNSSGNSATLDIILATYLFALQIYCDFSGYSDIARGVSKILGFELMVNFNLPYFSVNPSDFWRRWHISLSTWLRDYLYIPLGGNRQGVAKTYRNLMTTMVLGGLWHGAAWNFVYWGIYQGAILCIHRLIAGAKAEIHPIHNVWDVCRRALIIIVFAQVVCYGWMLFRANSLNQIYQFTNTLFLQPVFTKPNIATPPLAAVAGILVLFSLELIQYVSNKIDIYTRWPLFVQSAFYAILIFITLMGVANESSTFIYFQF